jgi:YARHG domain
VNFGACSGRKHAAMSTSPTNSEDRLSQAAQSFGYGKDEGLLSALSSVPNFPFADATSHPVDRKSDDQAQPATTAPMEIAGDSDVKRSKTTVCIPPNERQIKRPPRELPQRGLIPARVVSSRGYVDLEMPTPMLRRRGYDVKKLLATTAIVATVAGSLVVEILNLVEDSDLPSLPEFTSRAPPLPRAAPQSTEFRATTTGSEAERITQAESLQPTISLQPTARSENHPSESEIEVTLPQMVPGSEYEKIVGKTAVTPEPSSIARSGSSPIARLEPSPESPPSNQAPPHIGKVVVVDRARSLFADSNVRYLTRAELEGLSADRLRIARNEIFARKGRYFKEDALRTYFSQFPWYQPHAWDVPLDPLEQANVSLIQSAEAPAAATRSVTGPLPARTKVENGAAFADSGRRYMTPEELQGLSADQLAIVRNEIYGRRGRYFKDDALRAYFSQFSWYQPHAWDVPLDPLEQANVKLVQSLEQTASTSRQASRAWRVPPM